jgi:hypothetical protein
MPADFTVSVPCVEPPLGLGCCVLLSITIPANIVSIFRLATLPLSPRPLPLPTLYFFGSSITAASVWAPTVSILPYYIVGVLWLGAELQLTR